jgi:hypothetical protein
MGSELALTLQSKSAGLRNLGLGKPNPAMHDDAIHSASGPWRSVSNTGDRLAAEFNLLTFVDPATNQIYAVRVPKSNMATATNTNVNVNMATDRVLSAEYVSKYGSSKADASANWRSKVELSPPGAPPVPANSPMGHFNIATDPGVLTVEHLYEKFGKVSPSNFHYWARASACLLLATRHRHHSAQADPVPQDVIDAKPSQSLKSTTAAHETPKTKTTFGSDTTNHKANIQPASPDKDKEKRKPRKSRRDGRQRGTPGAGKHLKRTPTDDESADKATAAADLPPASPRKTRGSRAKALSPTPNRVKSAKA